MFSSVSGSGGDYRQKFISLERGTADQAAVHIRHRKEIARIAGLDATAVQNAQIGGDFSIPGPKLLANEQVGLLSLLRARRAARTDGPDRLIGNHCAGK